jgi:hypothetical protein
MFYLRLGFNSWHIITVFLPLLIGHLTFKEQTSFEFFELKDFLKIFFRKSSHEEEEEGECWRALFQTISVPIRSSLVEER